MYRVCLIPLLACHVGARCQAGDVSSATDRASGWEVYTLKQADTTVRIVPAAGANVFSIVVSGVEYLRTPEELAQLRGVAFGNPILYPTPNRVRGAQFSFAGRTYNFPANSRGNFIHGLVHSEAWQVAGTDATETAALIVCELDFAPGSRPYELFPHEHRLRMTVQVQSGHVRWTYEVDNRRGNEPLPFGLAYHPYFVYQGAREQAYLRVPAAHLMESIEQLPTGRLLELEGHPLDARQGVSLAGFVVDDVYAGMQSAHPTEVDFRDVRRRITLSASDDFTHLVVYTPQRPYFCVENQTCSTDAHNLAAADKNEVAHLQVCPAGEVRSGWTQYRFESY
jgi:aldose 1-epimerase